MITLLVSPTTTASALNMRSIRLDLTDTAAAAELKADCIAWSSIDWDGSLRTQFNGMDRMLSSQLDLLSVAERKVRCALARATAILEA